MAAEGIHHLWCVSYISCVAGFADTTRTENYSTRYREDLPLCIKGLSLEIKAGEKIGPSYPTSGLFFD